MSTALDMSLDDLIKKNKSSGANPRGRVRGAGPGPARRLSNRSANRVAPYSVPRAPYSAWQHDLFADQMPAFQIPTATARATAIETGTKLYISNLDYGVSNEDIKLVQELFSEVGDLKRHSIHYDRSGRSKGTAEVVFSKRVDALAAVKRYNNVQLDGKPMKIEIVGPNIPAPAPMVVPQLLNDNFQNFNPIPKVTSWEEVFLVDDHKVVDLVAATAAAPTGGGAGAGVKAEAVKNLFLLLILMPI